MNKKQAKIIKLLENTPLDKRNIYYIVHMFGGSYVSIYQELRILEAGNYLKINKSQISKKNFFSPTKEGSELSAQILKEED